MPRLVINPGTADAFELQLKAGVNSLGRSPENDFPIEHESVSSRHCEIVVAGGETTLFDLESAQGTFVGEDRVQQAVLQDGQFLRLGEVTLAFCADEIEPSRRDARERSLVASAPDIHFCRYHPKTPARYFCSPCGKAFCEMCVGTWVVDGKNAARCRTCGTACLELAPTVEVHKTLRFRDVLGGAFKYPVQGDGWVLLAAGTVFYMLLAIGQKFARFAGPYGFVAALILAIFGAGYLMGYLKAIVVTSAEGEERMPDWPDFTNWSEDIVPPLLQVFGIVAFCFWPVALASGLAATGTDAAAFFILPAWIFGVIYLPMAMLAVFMADSVSALSPLYVVPAIVKLGGQYWLSCGLMAVVVVVYTWLSRALAVILPIPLVPDLLSGFAGLYFLSAEMRILGLMYHINRERLAWF